MEWISVHDKLPDSPNSTEYLRPVYRCLIYFKNGYGFTDLPIAAYYDFENAVFSITGNSDLPVSHWMPLPEKPKN